MTHQPRKRFGQNFLTDQSVIQRIVDLIAPEPSQHLVEIGAGLGALTQGVLARAKPLTIIEIDRDLVEHLRATYGNSVEVHSADALEFDFATIASVKRPMRVFGNLPYNISTPLMFHLLLYSPLIQDMHFMLQKEVVDRMCASPSHKEYGRLSVMIQYACQPKQLFDIGPGAFSPPPKVMSSVVRLTPYTDSNRPTPLADNMKVFSDIVNVAFQHRRKTIRNALRDKISLDIFEALNLDPMRRPETFSVAEFVALSNAFVAE